MTYTVDLCSSLRSCRALERVRPGSKWNADLWPTPPTNEQSLRKWCRPWCKIEIGVNEMRSFRLHSIWFDGSAWSCLMWRNVVNFLVMTTALAARARHQMCKNAMTRAEEAETSSNVCLHVIDGDLTCWAWGFKNAPGKTPPKRC